MNELKYRHVQRIMKWAEDSLKKLQEQDRLMGLSGAITPERLHDYMDGGKTEDIVAVMDEGKDEDIQRSIKETEEVIEVFSHYLDMFTLRLQTVPNDRNNRSMKPKQKNKQQHGQPNISPVYSLRKNEQ